MAIIVVGGHARNVGKTSLVSAIIAAWPEQSWTAMKLSSHWHETVPSHDVSVMEDICRIHEEHVPSGDTDSGRYLTAGASRAYWIRVQNGRMQQAQPKLMSLVENSPNVIIESNGVVRYVHSDLFLMVVRSDVDDFKESACSALLKADAIVSVGRNPSSVVHRKISEIANRDIPLFQVPKPLNLTPELANFIHRCF